MGEVIRITAILRNLLFIVPSTMKKLFSLFLFSLFLSVATIVHAAGDIGNITVRFCEEDGSLFKSVSYEIESEEEKEVCLKIFNDHQDNAHVAIDFVDGTVTNDESQYKACKLWHEKQNFWQFVTIDHPVVIIPGKWSVEKRFTLKYPDGFAGMSYGCVVTQIVNPDNIEGAGMFSIELRKGSFVDFYVKGEIKLDLHFSTPEKEFGKDIASHAHSYVATNVANEGLASIVLLANSGNISQEATLYKTTYTWFGEKREENLGVRKIFPWDTARVITPVPLEFWEKGLITEVYHVDYTPVFDYNSDHITEEMKQEKHHVFTTRYLVIPWEMIGMVMAFVLFVVYAVRKYKANHEYRRKVSNSSKKSKSSTGKRKK